MIFFSFLNSIQPIRKIILVPIICISMMMAAPAYADPDIIPVPANSELVLENIVRRDTATSAAFNHWPWFWQRWFAPVLGKQRFEIMIKDNRIAAMEKSGSPYRYYIVSDKGRVFFYDAPDPASLNTLRNYAEATNLPMLSPADSTLLQVGVTFLTMGMMVVMLFGMIELYKCLSAKSKMRKSLKKSFDNALTFDDVAGQEGPKAALSDVVAFLKNPDAFNATGARMPSGILLEGDPGNGKTMLARAVAGEAGVPFFSASGSEFDEMWVGLGAARLRELFKMARKYPVSIVFIDEFDAIGGNRKNNVHNASQANQTINQLLTELDGFDRRNRVFFIGATNLAEKLDPALTRAGRLDRKVFVPHPSLEGREKILRIHSKNVSLDSSVDMMELARSTPGFSGASIAALVNEAAIAASNAGRKTVTPSDFESVMSKVMLGSPHGGTVMTENERKFVAYHEAGHALCGSIIPGADPVRFATILPHGRALGAVVQSPSADRSLLSRREYRARLAVSMAGRVAEEMIAEHPDDITGGAKGDIRFATALAREMVGGMGLCSEIGEVDMLQEGETSPLRTARVDKAVRGEIQRAKGIAHAVISANMDALHALAQKFLKHESISGDDVRHTLMVAHAVMPTLRD